MIFNLFKPKPSLKEFIPNGFVDIHSHVLPGVDDGAKNIQESMELISEMKRLGFSKIIATPHIYPGLYNNTNKTIKKSYDKISKLIKQDVEIKYASEYMIDKSLIKKSKNKELLCLRENYVLVEMSYISMPNNLYQILFEIQVNGYVPILAHPERYNFLNFDEYNKLKKAGCKFQINLLSLTGYYGKKILRNCNHLLKNKLADYCGSDIHNINQIKAFELKVQTYELKELVKIIDLTGSKFD